MSDKYIPKKAASGKTYLRDWWNAVTEANFTTIFSAFSKHINGSADRHKADEIDYSDNVTVKAKIDTKVDKISGKGLSTNDYTNAEKAEVAKIKDKVDKVAGKGLSANDYTDEEKAEVAKVKDKVDKVSGKGLSTNDFTSAYKTKLDNLDANLNNKVDKVTGKGLSKNDFTDDYKAKLDNLDANISETLAGKADKTEVLTKTNTAAFTPTADYQPATKKYVDDLASNKGGGDMMKAVYDQDASGTVDDSDKLGGQLPSYYAKASDLTNKVDKVSGKGLSTNDFTSAYKTKLDNLDTNLSAKANASDVLTKTNTTAFTPASDYQPATKKYVDDKVSNINIPVVDNLTSTSTTSALSANQGKVLNDKVTALPIKSLAGQKVKPASDTEVTASVGATIIGDMCERTFDDLGNITSGNVASASYSTAMNYCSTASGSYSVAMGALSKARGTSSTAIGPVSIANGNYSVAIGQRAQTNGKASVAIGNQTSADGEDAIALGYLTEANGKDSIAAGYWSIASGNYSVAIGFRNTALGLQTKIGKYGKDGTAGDIGTTEGDAFIVGNGTSNSARSNAFRVTFAGKAYGLSAYGSSGADYAEYFEWSDGNPDNEDRRGRLVTLDGEKIRFATAEDNYILGIISANPCVEGDIQPDDWQGKYLTDVFGQRLTQTVRIPDRYEEHETIDPETGETKTERILIEKEHDAVQWVLNPDYDPEQEYVSREDRKEWAPVGMMGKLVVIDDGTCEVNGFCKAGENGIATKANDGYRVMSRIDDTHLRVLVK